MIIRTKRMWFCLLAVLALTSAPIRSVQADPHHEKALQCKDHSANEFVRESLVGCLALVPSERAACRERTAAQFKRCKYRGDFARIQRRVGARLIILAMLRNISPTASGRRMRVAKAHNSRSIG